MKTWPSSGFSSRPATCSRVDLPEPDGPIRPVISPGAQLEIDAAQNLQRAIARTVAALDAGERQHRRADNGLAETAAVSIIRT